MKERLTWIPLSQRKNISSIDVIIEPFDNQVYGGYYRPGSRKLVVVEKPPWAWDDDFAATIAHEYRHHIQYELSLFKRISSKIRTDLSYEKQIAWYFNTFPWEMDALLFEYKHAKSNTNDWWLNHLVKPN